MFDTIKFGKALSTLRKDADMTQNEVADKLNLSRQAISKYERGESFPDISVLVMIAQLFGVTLDQLIYYGEPTRGESSILKNVASGNTDIVAENIADVVNLAPLLKPSVLSKLSHQFEKQGIDISNIILLAEYLNDETVVKLIENASFDEISDDLLEKFVPMLNHDSKEAIFQKILDGEMDWHFIKALLPYADYITTQIEAAVVEGVLPRNVLDILNDYCWDWSTTEYRKKR
ncbi:MAG: helix-turn-helix transcriptional regulator [Clostridia bacterium]|nr:helix-turn-helix transcriptional regulator [Clostridia bacterium]